MSGPWSGRRLHLIGVGGAGMSAYARAAHALGAQVTGSDQSTGPALERLLADGVLERAHVGHDAAHLPPQQDLEVYYSSAIAPENPERRAARERGIAERPRAALLGELSALRRTIAVAGTHGKTTSASMLVHALRGGGLEPGWLIGAPIGGGLANAHWSEGEWLVVEADESDRSMLSLRVQIALLTNVELDHHASFGSLQELRASFRELLAHAPQAVVWDRPDLLELREGAVVAFEAREVQLTAGGSRFHWHGQDVELGVPGLHNARNAAGALEAALLAGAEEHGATQALARFGGAARRFELVGHSAAGARIYDDYAHHPSEVLATLQAARTLEPRRLVAVFQPHLYSRTRALASEFARALALADVVAVLEVYPARERAEDHPGVSGLSIALQAADLLAGRRVYWLAQLEQAQAALSQELRCGDVCVVMGAGDSDALARALVAR